ncbi:hypothetical protein RJT34_21869 [Clitoria ternatea]|uniref:VQ domain-containing protein n=1 Tax=Clitoria ternatea TaxID=43366 RepID=A0AAN9IUT5_CLITE
MDTMTPSSNTTITTSNMSVQQTTPTKRVTKPKKKTTATKPIKVVYISNPMKIKTSASHFRALVQELTGQDAESPPDPSRFLAGDASQVDSDDCFIKSSEVPPPLDPNDEGQIVPSSIESNFEPLDDDDVFTPQMIENISALLPASVFYESQHLHHW